MSIFSTCCTRNPANPNSVDRFLVFLVTLLNMYAFWTHLDHIRSEDVVHCVSLLYSFFCSLLHKFTNSWKFMESIEDESEMLCFTKTQDGVDCGRVEINSGALRPRTSCDVLSTSLPTTFLSWTDCETCSMATKQEPIFIGGTYHIRSIFQGCVRGYTHQIWLYMVQYLHFWVLKFPLT